MSVLEVSDLSAGYDSNIDIIKDVSLFVDEAEIVTIIGPNGAGKSTLLKAISGELPPRKGSVTLLGNDITGQELYEVLGQGMCFVAQGRNIFPGMTIRENLEMGGYLLDATQLEAGIQTVHQHFPILAEREEQEANTLSGGQQQMLEMGMGLLHDPDIFLLDEPSAGLAPMLREEIFEKIEELREEGITFLMIEQNAREALQISDRGYLIVLGEVERQGTAGELLADDEVAELYLGGQQH